MFNAQPTGTVISRRKVSKGPPAGHRDGFMAVVGGSAGDSLVPYLSVARNGYIPALHLAADVTSHLPLSDFSDMTSDRGMTSDQGGT